MTGALLKREIWMQRQTRTEGRQCENTEGGAEHVPGVKRLQAEDHLKYKKLEEARKDSSLETSESMGPCRRLHSSLPASRLWDNTFLLF